jgi:hypothetical protein
VRWRSRARWCEWGVGAFEEKDHVERKQQAEQNRREHTTMVKNTKCTVSKCTIRKEKHLLPAYDQHEPPPPPTYEDGADSS